MWRKILVIIPVVILALFYFKGRYHNEYAIAGLRGKASLLLGLGLMFFVMAVGVYNRKQESFAKMFIQSSFLVYVFVVLTLTGYFLLFKEVAAHGWWHKVMHRIDTRERVNMEPFLMFKQFALSSRQVVGNAIMLLPLGIYIPLLFPRLSGFFTVFFICLLTAICIELMQLITSYRSTDIDDVILNTSGAVAGYIIYRIIRVVVPSPAR